MLEAKRKRKVRDVSVTEEPDGVRRRVRASPTNTQQGRKGKYLRVKAEQTRKRKRPHVEGDYESECVNYLLNHYVRR